MYPVRSTMILLICDARVIPRSLRSSRSVHLISISLSFLFNVWIYKDINEVTLLLFNLLIRTNEVRRRRTWVGVTKLLEHLAISERISFKRVCGKRPPEVMRS